MKKFFTIVLLSVLFSSVSFASETDFIKPTYDKEFIINTNKNAVYKAILKYGLNCDLNVVKIDSQIGFISFNDLSLTCRVQQSKKLTTKTHFEIDKNEVKVNNNELLFVSSTLQIQVIELEENKCEVALYLKGNSIIGQKKNIDIFADAMSNNYKTSSFKEVVCTTYSTGLYEECFMLGLIQTLRENNF